MRHATPKRAKQLRLYTAKRALFLAEHPGCERCGQRATEVHHKAGRSGHRLLQDELWAALCHDCHQLITEQPAWAIAEGWSLPRVGAA